MGLEWKVKGEKEEGGQPMRAVGRKLQTGLEMREGGHLGETSD